MIRCLSTVAIALFAGALSASCKGCSEECSDQKQGSEGCPCQSDQDCTTRLGEVLLCDEGGTCKPGNPPDADAKGCSKDSDCPEGEACGFKRCQPAPECQRIDVTAMTAVAVDGANAGPATPVVVARDGCAHTFSVGDPPNDITVGEIARSGAMSDVAGLCVAGDWHAAWQAGVFTCGATTIVIAQRTPCAVGKAGTACSDDVCEANLIATDVADVGVCP